MEYVYALQSIEIHIKMSKGNLKNDLAFRYCFVITDRKKVNYKLCKLLIIFKLCKFEMTQTVHYIF